MFPKITDLSVNISIIYIGITFNGLWHRNVLFVLEFRILIYTHIIPESNLNYPDSYIKFVNSLSDILSYL